MIEVLISMLILSIALSGLVELQVLATREIQKAYEQTEAVLQSSESP